MLHSHFPALHLPSVAALLDLRIPPTHRLAVLGGRMSGEDVYGQGHSTLIVYAMLADGEHGGSPDEPGPPRNRGSGSGDRSRSRGNPPRDNDDGLRLRQADPVSARSGRFVHGSHGRALHNAVGLCRPHKHTARDDVGTPAPLPGALGSAVGEHGGGSRLAFCAQTPLAAKGPAEPTEAQGLAIANLVFHGEAELLPAPFRRLGEYPPGANADPAVVASSEEEESQEPEQSRLHCVFQLFAVDHAPLSVAVTLDTPCTSADALSAVQAGVDADFYRRFPRLVEVRPQPFPTWGCYLALPAWTHLEPLVLLDLSAYDGRCFAAVVPSPFGSAQLRRISLLPDSAEVDVFALGAPRPMQDDDLVEAIEGGSVVFKPRGARWVVQGTSLQLMLWRGPASWDPAPAFPVPPVGFNLLLVNPAGIRFLAANLGLLRILWMRLLRFSGFM